MGKWRRARSTRLCTMDRKTSPDFGYAWRQELIINRDVTCESRLWEKPICHLERTVLEMFLLIMCIERSKYSERPTDKPNFHKIRPEPSKTRQFRNNSAV